MSEPLSDLADIESVPEKVYSLEPLVGNSHERVRARTDLLKHVRIMQFEKVYRLFTCTSSLQHSFEDRVNSLAKPASIT